MPKLLRSGQSFSARRATPSNVRCALDQSCRNSHSLRNFREPKRIAAVGCSDHKHSIALGSDVLDRALTIGRRIANVLAPWSANRRKSGLERVDDRGGVVDRKRGLGKKREIVLVGNGNMIDVANGFDERNSTFGNLTKCSDDFGVAGMADKEDMAAFGDQALGLAVNFGNERAGGIDID